jgi:hypothetical protein
MMTNNFNYNDSVIGEIGEFDNYYMRYMSNLHSLRLRLKVKIFSYSLAEFDDLSVSH